MERRRFSRTIDLASEWQTAFVVSHKMPWCALLTAVKNYNKSLEKLQDILFKTETKTKIKIMFKTKISCLSSRRLETKTLVSRTTSLQIVYPKPISQNWSAWTSDVHHQRHLRWLRCVLKSFLFLFRKHGCHLANAYEMYCHKHCENYYLLTAYKKSLIL